MQRIGGFFMIQLFINEDKKQLHHFTVKDSHGQILYLIEGYWGRKGDQVNLLSLHGSLILQAKQANFSPFFKFDLLADTEVIGSFRKHPGLFGLRDAFFSVQPNDWIIRGDFDQLYFTTFQNQQAIIKTNKLRHANALYSLKVLHKKDIPLASLLAVLLDHHVRKKQQSPAYETFIQRNYNVGFLNYETHSKLVAAKRESLTK